MLGVEHLAGAVDELAPTMRKADVLKDSDFHWSPEKGPGGCVHLTTVGRPARLRQKGNYACVMYFSGFVPASKHAPSVRMKATKPTRPLAM